MIFQEICQRPKFIAEGASRFDVEQGEQGDPWLLAAVSSLTLTPKFLDRVVPPDQNFEHGYCGVFRWVSPIFKTSFSWVPWDAGQSKHDRQLCSRLLLVKGFGLKSSRRSGMVIRSLLRDPQYFTLNMGMLNDKYMKYFESFKVEYFHDFKIDS